jgi:hypothetical protein
MHSYRSDFAEVVRKPFQFNRCKESLKDQTWREGIKTTIAHEICLSLGDVLRCGRPASRLFTTEVLTLMDTDMFILRRRQ